MKLDYADRVRDLDFLIPSISGPNHLFIKKKMQMFYKWSFDNQSFRVEMTYRHFRATPN